jgi:hypothetical protein
MGDVELLEKKAAVRASVKEKTYQSTHTARLAV